MKQDTKRVLTIARFAAVCLLCLAESLAGSARGGKGNLRVSPTSVNAGSTESFLFSFRAPGSGFEQGSQITVSIPAGWSPPQISDASGEGFVRVTPLFDGSAVSIDGITGTGIGPWTLTINFSNSIGRGGFTIEYNNATAPGTPGIYRFTAQSTRGEGVLTVLRSGSPAIAVNDPAKASSITSLVSNLNPSTYGDWITFTATVAGTSDAVITGTVTFLDGDATLDIVPLDAQGHASFSTNRLSALDSPSWITAEYSGDLSFNGSVSDILLQDVSPAEVTLSGLVASDKVYDGNPTALLVSSNVSLGGVLTGDDVGLDTSLGTAQFVDPNVGAQKVVNVSGLALSGVDADNYVLGPAPVVRADITAALLTVTANDTNRVFGVPNPVFTASYSGFVAGEDPSVLSGSPAFSTPAEPSSSVAGSPYAIVVTLGTLAAANYTFEFVPGSLTVTPGPAQPQRIVSIVKLADGTVALSCTGAAGQTYLLQVSPSLSVDSWTSISTNTTDFNGEMRIIDPHASAFPLRFYRTALP